jgi:hypothetical protein
MCFHALSSCFARQMLEKGIAAFIKNKFALSNAGAED